MSSPNPFPNNVIAWIALTKSTQPLPESCRVCTCEYRGSRSSAMSMKSNPSSCRREEVLSLKPYPSSAAAAALWSKICSSIWKVCSTMSLKRTKDVFDLRIMFLLPAASMDSSCHSSTGLLNISCRMLSSLVKTDNAASSPEASWIASCKFSHLKRQSSANTLLSWKCLIDDRTKWSKALAPSTNQALLSFTS